jgi:radical SAM protein with 4Fe4S-binding SPASM domain
MKPSPAPFVAALELTLRCPCRCQTCGSHAGAPRARELDHDEWLGVIGSLADLGCRRITLMGGEPLLYQRWVDLVRAGRARDMLVDLISCGQGLDENVALAMRDCGLHSVTISIDGLANTHDAQRRVSGCFEQALRAIRFVDQAGLKVGVTSQVNQGNLSELEFLAPILEDAGVLGWQLQLTLPLGRAEEHRYLITPPAMMPELLRVLRRLARRAGLRPHLTDNIGYGTDDDIALRTIQGGFPRPWLGCRAGLDALGVTSDGRVKGCLALPDICTEGNVRDESLSTMWNDPNRFGYNRNYTPAQLSGACADCEQAQRCRGGCTATAYAMHGRPGISTHCFLLNLRSVPTGIPTSAH